MSEPACLIEDVCAGDERSLARALTHIERQTPGYRDLVGGLYAHTTGSAIVGVTGSPGTGKSTLVDRLVAAERAAGRTVGVIAVDPASPFSGGSVLGDRVRLTSMRGDDGVFVRSMSARGRLGGVAPATGDALVAMDAFGFDRIIVETVGAGQSEVEVVELAETVVVVLQPGSGDDVQMLKAGILEIGDVFVVNKCDLPGVESTVRELRGMISADLEGSADGTDTGAGDGNGKGGDGTGPGKWVPPVIRTIATEGTGIEPLQEAVIDHRGSLADDGLDRLRRDRIETAIRRIVRDDLEAAVDAAIDRRGGLGPAVEAVIDGRTDPYAVADDLVTSVVDRPGMPGDRKGTDN